MTNTLPLEILRPRVLPVPENIIIGFSTRRGGVSEGAFKGLNLSTSTEDNRENVNINRSLWLDALEIKSEHLAIPLQEGGGNCQYARTAGNYPDTDALITTQAGVFLSILTADCTPILIWTEKGDLVAIVHSGWQGSQLEILRTTLINCMNNHHVIPEEIYLAFGPSLSQDNFEVGPEFSEKFSSEYLRPVKGSDRFYFDNEKVLIDQALELGIPPDQIEVMNMCTFDDSIRFFSHRRDSGKTGRMMSVIGKRS